METFAVIFAMLVITMLIVGNRFSNRKMSRADIVWKPYEEGKPMNKDAVREPDYFDGDTWRNVQKWGDSIWGKVGRLTLENGIQLSIIQHYGSYGGNRGQYEVLVLNCSDEQVEKLPFNLGRRDVEGHLTGSDLDELIDTIAKI